VSGGVCCRYRRQRAVNGIRKRGGRGMTQQHLKRVIHTCETRRTIKCKAEFDRQEKTKMR
jgi:hypothetical protein